MSDYTVSERDMSFIKWVRKQGVTAAEVLVSYFFLSVPVRFEVR